MVKINSVIFSCRSYGAFSNGFFDVPFEIFYGRFGNFDCSENSGYFLDAFDFLPSDFDFCADDYAHPDYFSPCSFDEFLLIWKNLFSNSGFLSRYDLTIELFDYPVFAKDVLYWFDCLAEWFSIYYYSLWDSLVHSDDDYCNIDDIAITLNLSCE